MNAHLIDAPDDAEVDIATILPVEFEEGIAAFHSACLKLAETLHVRRSTVEQAVSRHFKAEEIQRLFDVHGGLAKYKERACSAPKRTIRSSTCSLQTIDHMCNSMCDASRKA